MTPLPSPIDHEMVKHREYPDGASKWFCDHLGCSQIEILTEAGEVHALHQDEDHPGERAPVIGYERHGGKA